VKIDKKTNGAWLVHHANKLQQVTGVISYDNVLVAGKAAYCRRRWRFWS
jgi:hypothetical protein